MRIDVISDTICPWCWIGKRRFERARAERPDMVVEVGWRPFQLNPDMPADGLDRDEYMRLKFGNGAKAANIYAAIEKVGEAEGIPFRFEAIKRTPSTLDSHRLVRWAGEAGCQPELVETLFERYFRDGQDVGDRDVLVDVARTHGMDADRIGALLDGDTDFDIVLREDRFARELGISGVPTFLLERQYAVVGAEEPATFLRAFDQVAATEAELATRLGD